MWKLSKSNDNNDYNNYLKIAVYFQKYKKDVTKKKKKKNPQRSDELETNNF